VLNLPDADMVDHVDRIAKTTGSNPVPEGKVRRGYRFVADKFACAELSAIPSDLVKPPRAAQCPIQLEATLVGTHAFASFAQALEVRIERVHADESLLAAPNRIDPDVWRPLIMSFQRFYGLVGEQAGASRLAEIPEESYRQVRPRAAA
jgi:flavin reductase (DIM6/NTAB) family NADH-FMN oxidoreductase RutF